MFTLWLRLQRHWWRRKTHQPLLKTLLSEALHSRPFLQTRYVVIDLETTALLPKQGEIASIAWVVIEQGIIHLNQSAHFHIKLQQEVGQSAIYHQLTDTDLESGVALDHAMTAMLAAINNSVLVFHNAQLDMGFINHYLRANWGAPLIMPVVDTLLAERKRLTLRQDSLLAGDLRLFQCRQRYGLPDVPLHNALGDALATAELWLAMNA